MGPPFSFNRLGRVILSHLVTFGSHFSKKWDDCFQSLTDTSPPPLFFLNPALASRRCAVDLETPVSFAISRIVGPTSVTHKPAPRCNVLPTKFHSNSLKFTSQVRKSDR